MKNIITQSLLIACCSLFATLLTSNHVTAQEAHFEKCMSQVLHDQNIINNPGFAKDYNKQLKKIDELIKAAANQRVDDSDCSAGLLFLPVAIHYQDFTGTEAEQACLIELAEEQIAIMNNDLQGLSCDSANSWDSASGGCFELCLATKGHPVAAGIVDGVPAVTFGAGFCPPTGDMLEVCSIPEWNGYLNIVISQTPQFGVVGLAPLGGNPNATNMFAVAACSWGTDMVPCTANIENYINGGGNCTNATVGGRTATHELGHYLGLRHVFCTDASCAPCNTASTGLFMDCDLVADTPAQQFSQTGCPGGSANGSAGNPSTGTQYTYNNFMDYVDDACMNCFSAGQKARMQATYAANSGYKSKEDVCGAVVLPPNAVCGQLTSLTVGEPVCSADGYTYTITVSWEGRDLAVRFNGGEGSTPENGNAGFADSSITFSYSTITALGGYISVESENCDRFDNFFFDNPGCEYAPIPTMGEWGIMSLGMILLIFGVVAVRQTTRKTVEA